VAMTGIVREPEAAQHQKVRKAFVSQPWWGGSRW
jgi:hypothetical protein